MTLDASLPGAASAGRYLHLFRLLSPASGANNVVVTLGGGGSDGYLIAVAADYTGVGASGQPDATATHLTSGTVSSGTCSVTTVTNNDWAIMAHASYAGGSPITAGSGATLRIAGTAFQDIAIFDSNGPITPAGSYSMTGNAGGNSQSILQAIGAYSPAGGGGGFTPVQRKTLSPVGTRIGSRQMQSRAQFPRRDFIGWWRRASGVIVPRKAA